jgi:hypothetical protein
MKTKKLIYSLIFIGLISCKKDSTQNFEDLICGEHYQFWQVIEKHNYKGNHKIYEYFDKTGKWLMFEKFHNEPIKIWDGGDVYFYNEYRVMSDTVISITKGSLYWINSLDYVNKTFTLEYVCDGDKIKKYILPSNEDLKKLEKLLEK